MEFLKKTAAEHLENWLSTCVRREWYEKACNFRDELKNRKIMNVRISKDMLHAINLQTGERYKIEFFDICNNVITPLAEQAVKSFWFSVENQQYRKHSHQRAELLENGRVRIFKTNS